MNDDKSTIALDVPPTEPQSTPSGPNALSGDFYAQPKRRGRPPKDKTIAVNVPHVAVADGEDMGVIPAEMRGVAPQVEKVACWLGVVPECPVEFVTIGGIGFSKQSAQLISVPGSPMKRPLAKVGVVSWRTKDDFERISNKLRHTVIRFKSTGPDDSRSRHRTLDDLGTIKPREGMLITIPTAEEIRIAIENGTPINPYTPSAMDEPIAKYLFLHVCEDQTNPTRRADFYPPTLDETGLRWPSSLATKSA